MSYKHYLQSRFSSCALLAMGFDPHRQREVKVFAIPGLFDVVGLNDGVDAWIAPVIADPLSIGLIQIMKKIQSTGKLPTRDEVIDKRPGSNPTRRRAVVGAQTAEPPPPALTKERRRVILTTVFQSIIKARHVVGG